MTSGSSRDDLRDRQGTMSDMNEEDIRSIVAETFAEQQRIYHGDIDAVVVRAIATILTSFGIEEEDRRENCVPISSTSDVGARASSRLRATLSRL